MEVIMKTMHTYIDAKISNFIQRKLATLDRGSTAGTLSHPATGGIKYEAMQLPDTHRQPKI
jgi:hypothetical protein